MKNLVLSVILSLICVYSQAQVRHALFAGRQGINNLTFIEQDMDLNGEDIPYCMPTGFNWRTHNNLAAENAGAHPGGIYPANAPDIFPWFVIYPVGSAAPDTASTNTRIQVRNVEIYWLKRSTNTWIRATVSNTIGGYYNDCSTDTNFTSITVNRRNEPIGNGGGSSLKLIPGRVYQGWCNASAGPIDSAEVAGIWSYCEARLIVSNSTLSDDRSPTRYVIAMGGDYKNPAVMTNGGTVGGICAARFKYVTNNWRAFNMSTLSDAQWLAAPPAPVNAFD